MHEFIKNQNRHIICAPGMHKKEDTIDETKRNDNKIVDPENHLKL